MVTGTGAGPGGRTTPGYTKRLIRKTNTTGRGGGSNSFTGAGGTRYTGWTPGTYQRNPAAIPVADALRRGGTAINSTTLSDAANAMIAGRGTGTGVLPPRNYGLGTGSSGGGRGGGGGGGGGGGMTQEQLDWMMGLLGKGATNLDLPDYNEQFDPTMYNELEAKLGTAGTQSQAAADEAYGNLQNYLSANDKNAFAAGAPQAAAPGQDAAAMQRMLQSQGVGPEAVAANQQGAAAGNAAFSNLWNVLGANEKTAQQNRLNRVQTDRGTTRRGIDAAMLQGRTGIGMQRGQAQTAFNERAAQMRNQIAQQEAMANWTRQNQFRDQSIESLLGLMGQLGPGVQLPDLAQLGW